MSSTSPLFYESLDLTVRVVGVLGVVVVLWGVTRSLVALLGEEIATLRSPSTERRPVPHELRHHLGSYLLFGLELLVAADIIETILQPSLEHLAALGGLVLLRTLISFSLNWELSREPAASGKTSQEPVAS